MNKYNWIEIQKYYDEGYSQRKVTEKFGCNSNTIMKAIKRGDFCSRTLSEATKLYRKNNQKKLTNDQKKKISESMKKAHAEGRHPGWNSVNLDKDRRSYPEKFFINAIKKTSLQDNYIIIEKFSFGKYVFDFALIDLKIDIEIDGHHHYYDEYTVKKDIERDENSINKGWKVYRIAWKNLYHNTNEVMKSLIEYIKSEDQETIVKWEVKDIILKKKPKSSNIGNIGYKPRPNRRKVVRPSYKVLIKEIEESNYCKVGIKYGVSDNAIRKWVKWYEQEKQ